METSCKIVYAIRNFSVCRDTKTLQLLKNVDVRTPFRCGELQIRIIILFIYDSNVECLKYVLQESLIKPDDLAYLLVVMLSVTQTGFSFDLLLDHMVNNHPDVIYGYRAEIGDDYVLDFLTATVCYINTVKDKFTSQEKINLLRIGGKLTTKNRRGMSNLHRLVLYCEDFIIPEIHDLTKLDNQQLFAHLDEFRVDGGGILIRLLTGYWNGIGPESLSRMIRFLLDLGFRLTTLDDYGRSIRYYVDRHPNRKDIIEAFKLAGVHTLPLY